MQKNTNDSAAAQWWVVCLCAGWCGVCREYRASFEALAQQHAAVRWEWVDVEEQEALLEDLDIETFPTVLIGRGQTAFFLGPLLPQRAVLERLVSSFIEGAPPVNQLSPEATPLFQRVTRALA